MDWRLTHVYREHTKRVGHVLWHPTAAGTPARAPPCAAPAYVAASASDDARVCLYAANASSAVSAAAAAIAEDVQRVGCLLSFSTEGKSVSQLTWCAHAGSRAHLATAHADGSVKVWALGGGGGPQRAATLLAHLRGHSGRVLCVSWSLTDPNVIYTGAFLCAQCSPVVVGLLARFHTITTTPPKRFLGAQTMASELKNHLMSSGLHPWTSARHSPRTFRGASLAKGRGS